MKRLLWLFVAVTFSGCGKGPGNGASPANPPMTEAQAAEAGWKQWHASFLARDGRAAWMCLSTRTRSERSSLYRADVTRIHALSGAALDAEARAWGSTAAALTSATSEELAILALARDFGRPDAAAAESSRQVSGVTITGDVATIRLSSPGGKASLVALIKEAGQWKLDDLESKRATGR